MQPPTLQDQCLLRLIRRLEEYPPTVLASLPLHLRLTLLQNLPAADVCQLEHTAVTEGIDVDLNVWKKLVRSRMERVSWQSVGFGNPWKPDPMVDCTPTFKQKYFARVYTILLLGKFRKARSLLFSFHLMTRSWKSFAHMFKGSFPVLSRHECANSSVLAKVLLFAVQNSDSRPVGISIKCSKFIDTALWYDRDVVVSNLLSNLLSDTKSLVFEEGSPDDEDEAFKVPRFLLQAILTRPNPVLTSLSLSGSPEFLNYTLSDASVLFSSFPNRESLWAQYYPRMLPGSNPYSGLTLIDIALRHEHRSSLVHDEHLLCNIYSVVQHQSALESLVLTLDQPFCSSASAVLTLFDALGKLFLQPQFKILQLFTMELDWRCLSSLLVPFFASSVCDQRLHFEYVDLNLEGLNEPDSLLPDLGSFTRSRSHGKTLNFLWVAVSDIGHLVPFFHWLSHCQCAQVCSSFEFIYRVESITPGAEIAAPFMDLMTKVPQFEHFAMCEVSLPLGPSPVGLFCNLFSGPHLRSVVLRCGIGKSGMLPCLTQGLLKQIPHGQLEDLSLEDNQLGTVIDADFQEFCEAVFSLPQVAKLTLNLEVNQLKPHHFSVVHDAWKRKASPTKIKSFQAQDENDYEDEVLQFLIQDIEATPAN